MQIKVLPDIALERSESKLDSLRDKAGHAKHERARLKAAAREFEGIMMEMMLAAMRKNVPESPIFGHDNGRQMFNEMLDGQYARILADRGGIGLADLMVRQLDERQSGGTAAKPPVAHGLPHGRSK